MYDENIMCFKNCQV